jgi:SAM-dependent methyltransferase
MVHERGYYLDTQEKDGGVCERSIVESVLQLFKIETVVDLGCGAGRYTQQFIDNGIKCEGYDGNPLTPEMTDGLCKVLDITEPLDIGKFDLVFSLEVGEHIPKQFEQIFIDNLCNTTNKYIVVSWANVGLEWPGHVNCQNNYYVIAEFGKRNFKFNQEATSYIRSNIREWYHFNCSLLVFEK